MSPRTTLIYSTHAHWYASVPTALGRAGRLRRALVLSTPHTEELLFKEIAATGDYLSVAVNLVLEAFDRERWYRRPEQIRCSEIALTRLLAASMSDDVHVRTDAKARCFSHAEREYRALVLESNFAARTCPNR